MRCPGRHWVHPDVVAQVVDHGVLQPCRVGGRRGRRPDQGVGDFAGVARVSRQVGDLAATCAGPIAPKRSAPWAPRSPDALA